MMPSFIHCWQSKTFKSDLNNPKLEIQKEEGGALMVEEVGGALIVEVVGGALNKINPTLCNIGTYCTLGSVFTSAFSLRKYSYLACNIYRYSTRKGLMVDVLGGALMLDVLGGVP